MFMTTVQLPNATKNNSQMVIHTSKENADISISMEFHTNISDPSRANGLIDN